MSIPPDFKTNPKRDATDSIRGYVYQMYQSILAWMQLKENEILILEGAEDFDVHCGLSVEATQIKDVAHNLTLRSQDIIDSINNYWIHRESNPDYVIVLRFLTTAEAGQEQGSPFGSGQKGLEYWHNAEADHVDIEPLRTFLLTLGLNSSLATFIQNAADNELREKLIRRIKWDFGNRPKEALQYIIEDKLKVYGFKLRINSHYSCQALPHLLKIVADLLSTKGAKELRFSDFLSSFDDATTVSMPRSEMEAMISGNLQQSAANSEMLRLSSSPVIGTPIPLVDDYISRKAIVSNFTQLLREQRIIFLFGSSGLGKTNLAALISAETGGSWGWAGFRDRQPEQIKDILLRATFQINTAQLPPFLVLDDINLKKITLFEREFIALVFSVINANGMVIVTGTVRPPLQLLPKLWKNEICEISVPYFDETEVAEMACAHGLFDEKYLSAWAKTIWFTTSGHPQLVHARVRNLSTNDWPTNKLLDFTKCDDVERVRADFQSRLIEELPNENARILAYRLSVILGTFSRETAIAVAEPPPPLRLSGEAFDALLGPWIEKQGENQYRISPLLTGAAKNHLSEIEINAVHSAIAVSILGHESIDQFEISTAFYHAFMAKHHQALLMLAHGIVTEDRANIHFLYDAMFWFTWVNFEAGQKILLGNPSIDLMLRLAQFKLICCSSELDKALIVIERMEETLKEIEPLELKQYSEYSAYSFILNTFEVPISSSIVIQMLSRLIDLCEENPSLKKISDDFGKLQLRIPRIGENKVTQHLFSLQCSRLSGLVDLAELLLSLDALPVNKRELLLSVCDSDIDFAMLLINRAWCKELENGELDVSKTLKILEHTLLKSREWKSPELTKAALIAMSVIQDEYAHSVEKALAILNVADKEFPNDANLIYQRAKVLFHAKRNTEALPIAYKALELPGLSDVEFVYCCREAGIATAGFDDWAETERLFFLGADRATGMGALKNMGTGLMADAAFALWKQNKPDRCLLLLADVLDLLGSIPVSDDIRIRHLHATIRHSISWIHFNARGEHSIDLAVPLPGMCSNQNPHESMKEQRIIDISAAWELLASTERVLKLNAGIFERAEIVTGGKIPRVLVGYNRIQALDLIFKNNDFDNLVTVLIEMFEGFNHSKILKERQEDDWEIGDISKLPNGYWENFKDWDWFYLCMLAASVICTADNQSNPLPIERWRSDLANAGALSDDVVQFLNVLSGASPDDSLYQQAAASLFKLRKGAVVPTELWKACFRLLNACMNGKRWVEPALEKMLISRWMYAIHHQRFAFSTPSIICPEIEQCCLDQSLTGLSKIATVLDIAASYLTIPMSSSAQEMLKRIMSNS